LERGAGSIIYLLKAGEGLGVEFKLAISSVYKIAKTIASFSNTSGGILLIGIADDGSIKGIQSELRELQKLEKAVQLVEPSIILQVKAEIVDGKTVLRVEIHDGQDKPYLAINEKGERITYIRVKDKSIPVPKLLMRGQAEKDVSKVLATRNVKSLIQHLRVNDVISAKDFARMVNISDKRADRLLHDLEGLDVLISIQRRKMEFFALKLRQ
jgi:predicted HTH transcriptional regulator